MQQKNGWIPLHLTCMIGLFKVVKLLLLQSSFPCWKIGKIVNLEGFSKNVDLLLLFKKALFVSKSAVEKRMGLNCIGWQSH